MTDNNEMQALLIPDDELRALAEMVDRYTEEFGLDNKAEDGVYDRIVTLAKSLNPPWQSPRGWRGT